MEMKKSTGFGRPLRFASVWAVGLELLLFMALAGVVRGEDYTCTTNGGMITITGYTGINSAVTIPDTINGYPVVEPSRCAADLAAGWRSFCVHRFGW